MQSRTVAAEICGREEFARMCVYMALMARMKMDLRAVCNEEPRKLTPILYVKSVLFMSQGVQIYSLICLFCRLVCSLAHQLSRPNCMSLGEEYVS